MNTNTWNSNTPVPYCNWRTVLWLLLSTWNECLITFYSSDVLIISMWPINALKDTKTWNNDGIYDISHQLPGARQWWGGGGVETHHCDKCGVPNTMRPQLPKARQLGEGGRSLEFTAGIKVWCPQHYVVSASRCQTVEGEGVGQVFGTHRWDKCDFHTMSLSSQGTI